MRSTSYYCKGWATFVLLVLGWVIFSPKLNAQTSTAPTAGDGTSGSPYEIETLDNIYWLTQNSSEWNKYFIQTADIDASSTSAWDSGKGFSRIGSASVSFTGSYDGQGYTITGLTMNRGSETSYNYGFGVFGIVEDATLTNIYLEEVDISGKASVGALVGEAYGTTSITNTYVTGSVSGTLNIGGIIGNYEPGSTSDVAASVFSGNYSTATISGNSEVGGIAGLNFGNISDCYAIGDVSASTSSSGSYAGGIAGYSEESISDCYATGVVTAYNPGGLIGENKGTITGSYWNTETSGLTTGIDTDTQSQTVTGLTSSEMKTESEFSGWDFTSTWDIEESKSYPYLQSMVPDSLPGRTYYDKKPSGSGTEAEPYLVSGFANLIWISENDSVWGKYFEQTADFSDSLTTVLNDGSGLSPIGNTTTPFTGSYDGAGYTISDLFMDRDSENNVGLFGVVEDASLTDIGLEDADITGQDSVGVLAGTVQGSSTLTGNNSSGTSTGDNQIGGLIGNLNSTGTISGNYSSVTVTATGDIAGGLVGESAGDISTSYATGEVTADNDYVGGLIGNLKSGTISTSYAAGDVNGTNVVGGLTGKSSGSIEESYAMGIATASGDTVGGLFGLLNSSGTVSDSYATGQVNGNVNGGLGGFNAGSVTNAYAFGFVFGTTQTAGFLGGNDGTISGGYWNTETSGESSGIGIDSNSQTVTGLTTSQLRVETNYSGFDFTNTWSIDEGNSFAYLQNLIPDDLPGAGLLSAIPSGDGTSASPYLISSLSELLWLSQNSSVWDSTFQQTADIDASETSTLNSGKGFSPIGNSEINFSGSYDGADYSITGLFINRDSQDEIGLFGLVDSATLSNIGLENVDITGNNIIGALAGQVEGKTSITGCYSSGTISGEYATGGLIGFMNSTGNSVFTNNHSSVTVTGTANSTGGLIGVVGDSTSVYNSYATGDVYGNDIAGGLIGDFRGDTVSISYATGNVYVNSSEAGGLIGNSSSGVIEYSYATGNISGAANYAGGLIGNNHSNINGSFATGNVETTSDNSETFAGGLVGNSYSSITNSFATGNVTGISAGGFAGRNNSSTISNSYATGYIEGDSLSGGFVAVNKATITGSYWNSETSETTTGIAENYYDTVTVALTGLITLEMKEEASFSSFDFTYTWAIDEGNSFPYLQNLVPETLPTASTLAVAPSGDGTEASPYQISSFWELYWLSINTKVWDAYFEQTTDIDSTGTGIASWNSGKGFSPIGNIGINFSGSYDGANYTITGLYINRASENNIGLFGVTDSATFANIGLEEVNITGQYFVAGLSGQAYGNTSITNTYSTGTIYVNKSDAGGLVGYMDSYNSENTGSFIFSNNHSTATVVSEGDDVGGLIGGLIGGGYGDFVGGLIGEVLGPGTIADSYATGDVSGEDSVGGLIGYAEGASSITNCYATGNVSGYRSIGGLIGDLDGNLSNSYATGNVTSSGSYSGGLFGDNYGSVTNSYATGSVNGNEATGGLGGYSEGSISNSYTYGYVSGSSNTGAFLGENNNGTITGSYWNTDTSGQTDTLGTDNNSQTLTGLSTTEMRAQANFPDLDFTNTWSISEGNSFPYLQSVVPDSLPGTETVSTSPSGDGTEESPYLISNLSELYWLSVNRSAWTDTSYMEQTADIDASETKDWDSGQGFLPIGDSPPFYGTYDGSGYTITGLTIKRDSTNTVGLFSQVQGNSNILNINLKEIDITGGDYVGGLIGHVVGDSVVITGNTTSGKVIGQNNVGGLIGADNMSLVNKANSSSADVTGYGDYVGGLIGAIHTSSISNSFATGAVNGVKQVGGLTGESTGSVYESYATGDVQSTGENTGGLIGRFTDGPAYEVFATGNVQSTGINTGGLFGYTSVDVKSCYATGDVNGTSYVAGLSGALFGSITNCYSTGAVTGTSEVGAFLGYTIASITGGYWNTETSGQSSAIGTDGTSSQTVTGLTSAEMKQDSSFSTFDFDSTWGMASGFGEPYLQFSPPDSISGFPSEFYPVGSGTESSPYQIASLDNLYLLSQVSEIWGSGYYFQQTADIDASETSGWESGEGFSPIGNSTTKFEGEYDGADYTITSLTINRSTTDYIGLFGYTNSATLSDIALEDVAVTGEDNVGALVGYANSSSITGSYSTGMVTGTGSNIGGLGGGNISGNPVSNNHSSAQVTSSGNAVGGLFGLIIGSLSDSYATGDVSGSGYVGGLFGLVNGSGTISGVFASGDVTASSSYAGGLIGMHSYVALENCFATGSVNGTEDVGGLMGFVEGTTITNCFSTGSAEGSSDVGGLIGTNGDATISNIYWNTSTSGTSTGIGTDNNSQTVTGLTTAQMIDSTNFSGWDFDSDSAWAIDQGFSFPYLNNIDNVRMVVATIDGDAGWRMIGNSGDMTYSDLLNPLWTQGFTGADSESGSSNVYYYDEAAYSWATPSSADDYFGTADTEVNTSLNGILMYVYSDDDNDGTDDDWPKYIVAENTNLNETFEVSLDYSDNVSSDSAGWNLISNPYPVSLDWEEVVTNGDISDALPVAYIWDPSLFDGYGAYKIHYGYPLPPGVPSDVFFDGAIPAQQAFWVKASEEGATLTFKPDYQTDSKLLYKSNRLEEPVEANGSANSLSWLSLSIENETFKDQLTLFAGGEEAQAYNIPKLGTLASRYIEFSVSDSSSRWMTHYVSDTEQTFPLNLSTTETGTFSLSWQGLESFGENWEFNLTDNLTGKEISLNSDSEYSFEIKNEGASAKTVRAYGNTPQQNGESNTSDEFSVLSANTTSSPRFTLSITAGSTVSKEPEMDFPETFALAQNYPNPFNPSTVINYQLPETSKVRLDVFDIMGRRVATLVDGNIEAGYHSVTFRASHLASGMYLYRLQAGKNVFIKKLTLIK